MKKIYYYKFQPPHAVLAERAPGGGWDVEDGSPLGHLNAIVFADMYTETPPKAYRVHMAAKPFDLDINQAIETGTHTLISINTKDEIDAFHESHPDGWYLDGTTCSAIRYQDFPLCWVGFVEPGENLMTEKNAQYGFPLFGLAPTTAA